jgi:hypothetical protein
LHSSDKKRVRYRWEELRNVKSEHRGLKTTCPSSSNVMSDHKASISCTMMCNASTLNGMKESVMEVKRLNIVSDNFFSQFAKT